MATQSRQQQGGLSIQTLAIASLASAAAAIVVHEVWRGGAILGAAITPIIVAIVSESLRKPVDRAAARREARRSRTTQQQAAEDRFGIWEADRPRRRLNARHLNIALATGALAFVIGALALTATELVFGGNVGSGGRDTTIVGGGSDDREAEEKTTQTETQPAPAATTAEPAPTPPEEEPIPTTTAPLPEGATPPTTEPPATEAPQTVPTQPPVEPAPAEPTP